MDPEQKKGVVIFVAIVIIMAGVMAYISMTMFEDWDKPEAEENELPEYKISNQVLQIADGDTFQTADGEWIRMLCINTEEKGRPWATEATHRLKQYLQMGEIELEADAEDRDAYGRLLRYVYVTTEDGERLHVNVELVREGYAHAFIFENNQKYKQDFFAAEWEARNASRRIWIPSMYDVEITLIQAVEDGTGANSEYVLITNVGTDTVNMTDWTLKDQSWHNFKFPELALAPGANVTVHTGAGTNTTSDLYWDYENMFTSSWSGRAWDDDGEVGFLRDSDGLLADFYDYGDRIQ